MNCAVIVAAGLGTRMGPGIDKLFLEVAGRPLVAHTWGVFDRAPMIHSIVMVVREGMGPAFTEMVSQYGFKKRLTIVHGGRERQDSVWNGIQAVPDGTKIIAIQDGARPCSSEALIAATIEAARSTGAAVAAQKITDTIKESDGAGKIARNIDRAKLWAVQTPQVFRAEVIRAALSKVIQQGIPVTDDTSACELIGQSVQLVESPFPNPKATSPADLPYIELLIRSARPSA
ncbi:MAG: ispD [Verrucomicrobiales bacterium]|nr:ispD [Verrucomicrobiales bacterium]